MSNWSLRHEEREARDEAGHADHAEDDNEREDAPTHAAAALLLAARTGGAIVEALGLLDAVAALLMGGAALSGWSGPVEQR